MELQDVKCNKVLEKHVLTTFSRNYPTYNARIHCSNCCEKHSIHRAKVLAKIFQGDFRDYI